MPGQGRILVPADQLQGLWTETGGTSVSRDLGFVEEHETRVERLVLAKYAVHCGHSNGLWCQTG